MLEERYMYITMTILHSFPPALTFAKPSGNKCVAGRTAKRFGLQHIIALGLGKR